MKTKISPVCWKKNISTTIGGNTQGAPRTMLRSNSIDMVKWHLFHSYMVLPDFNQFPAIVSLQQGDNSPQSLLLESIKITDATRVIQSWLEQKAAGVYAGKFFQYGNDDLPKSAYVPRNSVFIHGDSYRLQHCRDTHPIHFEGSKIHQKEVCISTTSCYLKTQSILILKTPVN